MSSSNTAKRPPAPRSVSFAPVGWEGQGGSDEPTAPAEAHTHRPRRLSLRPAAALRSISFAHIRRPSATPKRPAAPARSLSFGDTRWQPAGYHLALRQESVAGPVAFLNPTTAIFDICGGDEAGLADLTTPGHGQRARVRWNAREFRKGRHVFVLPRAAPLAHRLRTTSKPKRVLLGILRMFTVFPYWDISWWIGVSFTIGCLLFVACGFFYWLPVAYPETEWAGEKVYGGGLTAFIGATLFQIGAILLLLEAYNDRAETKFGKASAKLVTDAWGSLRRDKEQDLESADGSGSQVLTPEDAAAARQVSKPAVSLPSTEQGALRSRLGSVNPFGEREWQWLPTWHDVRTHYIYEIGFLASFTMSLGATIFYLTGILALPGIELSKPVKQGIYFLPYLVGGILFWVSSALYMLETQPNWYTPQPFKIGWHIGLFNMLGGIGWTLAASFGYCDPTWCEYQSQLSLIWASCAFSFGAALQWYESLDKYVFVIEDEKRE